MRNFPYAGPGFVVLAAAAAALLAAPFAIRRANDAQADSNILRAKHVLEGDGLAVREVIDEVPLLEQINRANRAIAKLVEPSVVHVSTMMTQERRNFSAPYAASGSGWVWDLDGHIVTNAHVVEGSDRLQVQLYDGELREAELVGIDLRSDIAVIKISSGGLHASIRGDSSSIEQGDMVYAFGSPFDFRFSMSSGIVSGLGRSAGLVDIDYENFIQTDAAINPGNSGGPLTDVRGRVIGMNTAIATGRGNGVGQGQFAGIGLAIPMSMIESTVTQLIENGEVRKGYLGVQMASLEGLRQRPQQGVFAVVANDFKGEGVVVSRVTDASPALRAGFQNGDVITSANGQKVATNKAVSAIISSTLPGGDVKFEIWRANTDGGGGVKLELTAQVGELEADTNVAPQLLAAFTQVGLQTYETATAERAAKSSVPFRRGVILIEINDESELANSIPEGSTITAVFEQPIGSVDELYTRTLRGLAPAINRGMAQRNRLEIPLTVTTPDGRVLQVIVPIG
jgi:serine protease Do